MYKVVTYHILDEALIKRWHDLWNESKEGHFFNSPEWFLATCTSHNIKLFTIVTIEERQKLLLVLPLVYKKIFGIPALTCPGGKFVNKSALLIRNMNPLLLSELRNFLIMQGNFYLRELDRKTAHILSQGSNRVMIHKSSINPYLPIRPDPFFYLSRKNRSQIRGIIRKNEDNLTFKHVIGDKKALETVFEIDRQSSKRLQGKATFVTERDKNFFRELFKKSPKNFVIDIVYHKNVPVVYGVGFIYKNIYHAWLTAFDNRYRFLRPGKLFAYFLLTKLQEDKFTLIDFGPGNSILKQEFTRLTRQQYTVFYIPSSIQRQLLITGQTVYQGFLKRKYLYSTYLFFKKYLLYR